MPASSKRLTSRSRLEKSHNKRDGKTAGRAPSSIFLVLCDLLACSDIPSSPSVTAIRSTASTFRSPQWLKR